MRQGRFNFDDSARVTWAIVIIVVSTLISTIYALLSYFLVEQSNGFVSLTYGIVLSILFSCLGLLLEQSHSISSMRAESKNVMDLVSKAGPRGSDLAKVPQTLRGIAERALSEIVAGFTVIQDGFRVNGEFWALKSHLHFWQWLVNEQRARQSGRRPGLTVRITHSNSIEIWEREIPEVDNLLQLQKEFHAVGGHVARIFIGTETSPNTSYQRVIDKMRLLNISTFYLPQGRTNLAYDFLWVDEYNYVVKWYAGAGGASLSYGEISKATDAEALELSGQWKILWRRIAEIEERGQDKPFNDEIEMIFA